MESQGGQLAMLRTPEELDVLLKGLDKRGTRELALHEALEKVLTSLRTADAENRRKKRAHMTSKLINHVPISRELDICA